MSLICDEPHPAHPEIRCDHRPGNHKLHSGRDPERLDARYIDWPNTAYKPPVRKADAATGKTLAALAREIAAARKGS